MPASPFDYSRSAPLDVREGPDRGEGGARVFPLTYSSPQGGRVTAFRVTPATGDGPFAGILFLHWGMGNRASFLSEAFAYAQAGAECLLLDAPGFGGRGARLRLDRADSARRMVIQTVAELRRGVDLLCARREVDPARLAFVGHSLGASVGGQLVGSEPRLRAAVLAGGWGEISRRWSPTGNEIYRQALAPLDGVKHVRQAKVPLLFQFARRDEFISEEDGRAFSDAAPEPKRVVWYDADHAFNAEARRDRAEWLREQLGLGAVPTDVLDKARFPFKDRFKYLLMKPFARRVYRKRPQPPAPALKG